MFFKECKNIKYYKVFFFFIILISFKCHTSSFLMHHSVVLNVGLFIFYFFVSFSVHALRRIFPLCYSLHSFSFFSLGVRDLQHLKSFHFSVYSISYQSFNVIYHGKISSGHVNVWLKIFRYSYYI